MNAGDQAAIQTAIDTQAAGQSVTGNTEVMQLIEGVDGNANAWAVGFAPEPVKKADSCNAKTSIGRVNPETFSEPMAWRT